jgi:hypothetical protein
MAGTSPSQEAMMPSRFISDKPQASRHMDRFDDIEAAEGESFEFLFGAKLFEGFVDAVGFIEFRRIEFGLNS